MSLHPADPHVLVVYGQNLVSLDKSIVLVISRNALAYVRGDEASTWRVFTRRNAEASHGVDFDFETERFIASMENARWSPTGAFFMEAEPEWLSDLAAGIMHHKVKDAVRRFAAEQDLEVDIV